jgi:hypothetical protein
VPVVSLSEIDREIGKQLAGLSRQPAQLAEMDRCTEVDEGHVRQNVAQPMKSGVSLVNRIRKLGAAITTWLERSTVIEKRWAKPT